MPCAISRSASSFPYDPPPVPATPTVVCRACHGTGYDPDPRPALAREIRARRRNGCWSAQRLGRLVGCPGGTIYTTEISKSSLALALRTVQVLREHPVQPGKERRDPGLLVPCTPLDQKCQVCKGKCRIPDPRIERGARLQERRMAGGWSRCELGRRTGIKPNTINTAETGRSAPRIYERLEAYLDSNPQAPPRMPGKGSWSSIPPARTASQPMRRQFRAPDAEKAPALDGRARVYHCSEYNVWLTTRQCEANADRPVSSCRDCKGAQWRVRQGLEPQPLPLGQVLERRAEGISLSCDTIDATSRASKTRRT